MDTRTVSRLVDHFRTPKRSLGEVDADAAAKLIAAASDIAVVVDAKGVVRDLALGSEELSGEDFSGWVGQPWLQTVTIESRGKIEELMREASAQGISRWRQINHPSKRGDIPVRYSAVQLPSSGRIVAFGRDLRATAALQQRLVDTQQSMEQEYQRLRQAETRYRLLFQISSEAVLILDAASLRIVEANPAAGQLLSKPLKKLTGRSLLESFSAESQQRIQQYMADSRSVARPQPMAIKLDGSSAELMMSASFFRQDGASLVLVRLAPTSSAAASWLSSRSNLLDVVQKLPDGFVVADLEQRILSANTAFLDLTQLANEEQVRGESLQRWLGRHPVDVNVLVKNARERGEVRNFVTAVRGEYGSISEVEVSAVCVPSGDQPCLGMAIRAVGRRPEALLHGQRQLPRSVQQLSELVGRVPLKDLVRESTDLIERLCIEAALELTGDNRASAAEMLGLSRQGFYSKMRRHGLGDLGPGDE